MSYEIGTATSHTDLLNKLNAFLLKGHTLMQPVYSNPVAAIVTPIGKAASVYEVITVTFTSATAFGVVGSVTGSLGTGTTGTPFTSSKIDFTIPASGSWANGNTIVMQMTPPWVADRSVTGSEYIWHAPGNDNLGAIYVGARVFEDTNADYYNWQLGGFTGYSAGLDFGLQPGSIKNSATLRGPVLPLWDSFPTRNLNTIPYWFRADGRGVVVVAKVSSVYEPMIAGFIDTYPTPGQYPYPLAVGGGMGWYAEPAGTSVNWRWSYSGSPDHSAFFKPSTLGSNNDETSLRLRRPDGYWRGFSIGYSTLYGAIWPYADGFDDQRPNLNGSYELFPIVLSEDQGSGTVNLFGELPGIYALTGFNNASENTVVIGMNTYLVVQNIFRTTKTDYMAVRLT